MPLFEGKTPAERNKTIAALVLGVIALLFVGRMLFGSSSTTKTTTRRTTTTTRNTTTAGPAQPGDTQQAAIDFPQPIPDIVNATYNGGDGGRNIFAFYEPPVKPTPDPNATPVVPSTPTPTPTPPPPLTLSSTNPNLAYARAETFSLVISGDKFTPQARVYLDGQELPTTYQSPQQLTAEVAAALISAPGTRQVVVRTPDGQLYSNPVPLNIAEAPKPQLTYIGLLGGVRYNDKALLKRTNNEVVTVQRGDIVDQRFRVIGISERAVDFVDTQLKIKHTLPYVESKTPGGVAGQPRPYLPQPPKPDTDDDDEPQP